MFNTLISHSRHSSDLQWLGAPRGRPSHDDSPPGSAKARKLHSSRLYVQPWPPYPGTRFSVCPYKGRGRFQRYSRFQQDTAPKDEIYPESRLFCTSVSDEFQEFSYLRTKLIHLLYGEDGVTGYDSCIAVRYTGPLAHRVDSLFTHPSSLRQVKPSSVVGGPERESSDQL